MLTFLDIILIVVAVISVLVALQSLYLRRKEKNVRQITSDTSPSTLKALNDLETIRRPDEIFFIRMVRDLKSPLTLLSGPVEQLGNSQSLSPEDRKMLSVMKTAVTRMETIVEQLSDYSQPDFRGLRLSLHRDYPVCTQIRKDTEYFRSNADLLGIKIDDSGIVGEMRIPLDLEKFDSIFHSLLYSALKFVFREGEVSVRSGVLSGGEVSRKARVTIEDKDLKFFYVNIFHSGETLDEDALEAIFGREYLYLDSREFAGVGLYYARELTKVHHGYIWASNSEDGKGVDFTLAFPAGEEAYSAEELGQIPEEVPSAPSFVQKAEVAENAGDEEAVLAPDGSKPTIMVVEEDTDMLSYLSLLLENSYNVLKYRDNVSAEEFLSQGTLPDIVIADLSNSSDGAIELCCSIRRNDLTCRIPFIMITNEKKDDGNIDALQAGADAMLDKPFKPAMLSALVSSLIRRRDLSRGHVIAPDDMVLQSREVIVVSEEDRLLFDALCAVIREHAGNPELTVPLLCEMLHLSRTKLYNKVNGMVGMSPKRFIHEYRLKIAAQMLAKGNMTVGEVADATGFNSQSYFAKAFRKRYGRMPSQMKRQ